SAWKTIGAFLSCAAARCDRSAALPGITVSPSRAAASASRRSAGWGRPVMRRVSSEDPSLVREVQERRSLEVTGFAVQSSILKVQEHRYAKDQADPGRGPRGKQYRDFVRQPQRK